MNKERRKRVREHLGYAAAHIRTRDEAMSSARRYRDARITASQEIIRSWIQFARMCNRFAVHQMRKAENFK